MFDYEIYRLKYHFGKHLPLRKPVDVSLELSSQCNMRCSYCYHADQKNLPFNTKTMEWETAHKILKQAADLGVHSIKTNWRGESTINRHFERITAYAKERSNRSVFIDRLTNSNFKFRSTREDIFRGLANQTKVKVSYDSFRKDVFEVQRNGGDHDITTRNIDIFYNHADRIRSGTKLVIQAVRTVLNKDEDIEHECKKRWPDSEVSIRDMVAGRVESDKVEELEHRSRDFANRQSCKQAHVRLIFDWNGVANPCCPSIRDDLQLGSIHEKSLYEIFNGALARDLRKDLKSGKAFEKDPCKTCSSFESFKGSRIPWHS